jgi:hypothetical protein
MWATAASIRPQPSLALIDAILEKDVERIDAVASGMGEGADHINWHSSW